MDPNSNNARDVTPHRPSIGTPPHRPVQRPVFSDFTTRPSAALNSVSRPTRPTAPAPQPTATPQPIQQHAAAPHHVQATHHGQPTHTATAAQPATASAPRPVATPVTQPAPAQHQPQHAPAPRPAAPQLDGFLRPSAAAAVPQVATTQPAYQQVPAPQSSQPAQPARQPQHAPAPQPLAAAMPATQPPVPADLTPASENHHEHGTAKTKPAKAPRVHSETGHAGLVGFVLFVVLTAVFALPLLPGKTLDNFPGSSASFSTGDQSLACIDQLENQTTSTSYDSKAGSPITYRYATSTHQTASCDGKSQSAVTGHTSQFNPLGLLIDIVSALVIAIIVSKVWGMIAHRKN